MLVLTRRKHQKVLFPHLGIAIEIVHVRGKDVQLGIDAPRDIRVIRGELEFFENAPPISRSEGYRRQKPAACGHSTEDIRQQLDAANLALQLARNQLRQGLNEPAMDAVEQALQSLRSLESLVSGDSNTDQIRDLAVHESKNPYQVSPDLPQLHSQPTDLDSAGRIPAVAWLADSGLQVAETDDCRHVVPHLLQTAWPKTNVCRHGQLFQRSGQTSYRSPGCRCLRDC